MFGFLISECLGVEAAEVGAEGGGVGRVYMEMESDMGGTRVGGSVWWQGRGGNRKKSEGEICGMYFMMWGLAI